MALAKSPEDRFPRCADFSCALAEQAATLDSRSSLTANRRATASPEPTTKKYRGLATAQAPHRRAVHSLRQRWLVLAAALAIVVLAGLIAIAWHPWDKGKRATETGSSSLSPTRSSNALSEPNPSSAPPPPPATFAAKAINSVVLTAAELSNSLGVDVNSDVAKWVPNALKMDTSSNGTSDHSAQVKPRSCVGVIFTAEASVYDGTDYQKIQTQSFSPTNSASYSGPESVDQTVAIFPSASMAQQFLASSQSHWDTCTASIVDVTLGYEDGRGFKLGSVVRQGDLITVSMASSDGLTGDHGCQQALGARDNVVVETRTCLDFSPN